jgi:uncharacterized protein YebE (UPF0316 family)
MPGLSPDINVALQNFANSDFVHWIGLPLLIFVARIFDVTLQTLRIIMLSSGKKNLAPILGFFEVLVWVVVISQLVRNLATVAGYLAYAAGFATGTLVGIWLEKKLSIGMLLIRIITVRDATPLITRLRASGYGVTEVEAHGATGLASLIYTVIRRKDLQPVMDLVKQTDPGLFVSVETITSASQGTFPPIRSHPFGQGWLERHGR